MRCARCKAVLTKPAVLRAGMSFGPVCAAKLGLLPTKPKRPSLIPVRRSAKAESDESGLQGWLFDEVLV